MKLSIGFSPCPNDTFIFEALVNHKIDTEGISFDVRMEDVEQLNQWALQGALDITKISYGVLPSVLNHYQLLDSGSALGSGVGPLLISHPSQAMAPVEDTLVAIPGEHTTAHGLFSLAYPAARQKVFMRYDQIESFVQAGEGLGVIIHENRFTYESKGLVKRIDLGEYWEEHTQLPIPLGGIVMSRKFDTALQQKIDRLIQKSIVYAYAHNQVLNDFIHDNAQEMSEAIMRKHIELYVNQFSLSLGEKGRAAVQQLLLTFASASGQEIDLQSVFMKQG